MIARSALGSKPSDEPHPLSTATLAHMPTPAYARESPLATALTDYWISSNSPIISSPISTWASMIVNEPSGSTKKSVPRPPDHP